MKNMLKTTLLIIGMMTVLFTTSYTQETIRPTPADEEIIKIQTSLVRVSFIAPSSGGTSYEIFEGSRKVEDYRIITPETESKLHWVFYLDVNPKKQPRFALAPLRRHLKKLAEQFSAPIIIVNLENLTLDRARSLAGIPKEWKIIGADNTAQALKTAAEQFGDAQSSRRAFFWLTTEPGLNANVMETLPNALTDKSIFTFISTLNPEKTKKRKNLVLNEKSHIAVSNLSLNTYFESFSRDRLLNMHFSVFGNQCGQLNLLYFQPESEIGENRISIYEKSVRFNQLIQTKIY